MDEHKTETQEFSRVKGKIEDEFLEKKKSSKKWIWLSGFLVLAVILGVIASIVISKSREPEFSMMEIYLENMAEKNLGTEVNKRKYAGLNKYNHMGYKNVSGITIKEQADKEGMDFEEYKKTYGLPKDMPEDTYFDAAYNMMPIKIRLVLDEGETDFVTFKKNFNVPDYIEVKIKKSGFMGSVKALFGIKETIKLDVTEDLPWGVVYDELPLEVLVEADKIEQFKKEYNLDEKVNLSTKYKEVRQIIEEEKIKNRDNVEPPVEEEAVAEPEPDVEVLDEIDGNAEVEVVTDAIDAEAYQTPAEDVTTGVSVE